MQACNHEEELAEYAVLINWRF